MKCKYCGSHYAWYQDVDGCCSPSCANAFEQERNEKGLAQARVMAQIIKMIMISIPYVSLAIFGLRQIFTGMVNHLGLSLILGIVIFSAIYLILRFIVDNDGVNRVLSWIKKSVLFRHLS